MEKVSQKQTKDVKVNLGQRLLRQEQENLACNLEALKKLEGWQDLNAMITNQFIEAINTLTEDKDEKVILRAVSDAKAILKFAKSIGIAINKGEIATKLLEESYSKNKPCK